MAPVAAQGVMDTEDLKLLPRHELKIRVLQILEAPGNTGSTSDAWVMIVLSAAATACRDVLERGRM